MIYTSTRVELFATHLAMISSFFIEGGKISSNSNLQFSSILAHSFAHKIIFWCFSMMIWTMTQWNIILSSSYHRSETRNELLRIFKWNATSEVEENVKIKRKIGNCLLMRFCEQMRCRDEGKSGKWNEKFMNDKWSKSKITWKLYGKKLNQKIEGEIFYKLKINSFRNSNIQYL